MHSTVRGDSFCVCVCVYMIFRETGIFCKDLQFVAMVMVTCYQIQLRLFGDVIVWESFLDQKHVIIPCLINLHAVGCHSFQLIVSNFLAEPSVDASYMIIHDIECRRALAKMKYNADGQCRYGYQIN